MEAEPYQPSAIWALSGQQRVAYQKQRLLQQLRWAVQCVPFYQGLNLNIRSLQEAHLNEILNSLPIVTKDLLRGRNPDFLSSESMSGYWSRTGGSTGEPTEIFYDRKKIKWGKASVAFARGWWGVRAGQRCFYMWGHSASLASGWRGRKNIILRSVKDLLRNRFRVDAYRLDQGSLRRYVQKLIRIQPTMIIGYTSAIYLLAQRFQAEGYSPADLPKLRCIIVTADPCFRFQSEIIQDAFGAPLIEEYGSAEIGVIAYSHPDGSFRVLEDRLIVETPLCPDSSSGQSEAYSVIVTDLSARFQPLIRFDMADLCLTQISAAPDDSGFQVMGKVAGRVLDTIHGHTGQMLHGVVLSHIVNSRYPDVLRYRFYQNSNGEIQVALQLKPTKEASMFAEKHLIRYLKDKLGESIGIKIKYVDGFPETPSGKFRWVVSELDPNSKFSQCPR